MLPSGYFTQTVVVTVQVPMLPLQVVETVVTVSFANACNGNIIASGNTPIQTIFRSPHIFIASSPCTLSTLDHFSFFLNRRVRSQSRVRIVINEISQANDASISRSIPIVHNHRASNPVTTCNRIRALIGGFRQWAIEQRA